MKAIDQTIVIILTTIVLNSNCIKFRKSVIGYRALPCEPDEDIVSYFQKELPSGYNITVKKYLVAATSIRLQFDSQTAVFLDESATFSHDQDNIQNIFDIILLRSNNNFTFNVRGQGIPFSPPYLTSLKINGEEACQRPNLTYFSDFPVGVLSHPDRQCGRRKIIHTDLIVSGVATKAGDWPWHAAINKQDETTFKYICGGSLVSKHFVLTAAHCVTMQGTPLIPDIFGVVLGKYHLPPIDVTLQDKEVYKVFVHPDYRYSTAKNDIALLKLKTEVVFNNYVQPACLWTEEIYNKLPKNALGTVVGWGFDKSDSLSSTLKAAHMPHVQDIDCIYHKPEFYGNLLKDKKRFCAGYANGTSPCNGDSGGAFVYFIPDIRNYNGSTVPGAWYIKGIVSNTLARQDVEKNICDPNAFAIFTDVAKFLPWIHNIIDY